MIVARFAVFLATLTFPLLLHAQTICGPQNYDATTPPNFNCPGPEEDALTADLSPAASIPVRPGMRVVDGARTFTIEWDGAIVHRERLLDYGLRLHAVRRLRWADRLRLAREAEITSERDEQVCAARVTAIESERDTYIERLRLEESRVHDSQQWYRSVWFGVLVGVVGTGALIALTAYALHAID